MSKNHNSGLSIHYHTMNYLYQAANFLTHKGIMKEEEEGNEQELNNNIINNINLNKQINSDIKLSKHLLKSMKKISSKNVLRIHPSLKRTICKKCGILFIPDKTCKIREFQNDKNKQFYIEYICLSCGKSKTYLQSQQQSKTFQEEEINE
ncbi:hypothetical protein ABK040_007499 [Willaertia magna]